MLTSGGIRSSEDLMILENEDIVLLLPRASVLVKRRLSNMAKYLAAGSEIDSTTTIRDIMISVSRPNRRTDPTTTPTTDNTARGAPKLYVDGLETFDGTPIKWENWEMNTFATLGQTVYFHHSCHHGESGRDKYSSKRTFVSRQKKSFVC
jgi:hypothetical protein